MSWSRLSFPVCLITILIFAGAANGQNPSESQEKWLQPLQSGMVNQGQWPQPLRSARADREQQGLYGLKSTDKSNYQVKNNLAPKGEPKKSAKSPIPKPHSFGPSSRQYGVGQGKPSQNELQFGPQIGASGTSLLGMGGYQSSNPGTTSFLDGYLLKSLHGEGLEKKKSRSEDKPKDDPHLRSKTTSRL